MTACLRCGSQMNKHYWHGAVCPNCRQVDAINKQTKILSGQSKGNGGGGVGGVVTAILNSIFGLILAMSEMIIRGIFSAIRIIFEKISPTFKNWEKENPDQFRKFVGLAAIIAIVALIIFGALRKSNT